MSEPPSVEELRQQILETQKIIDDLNRDLSRKTKEVRIIQEISSEINATLDLDNILESILRSMDSVFGFEHSMILLLDEPAQVLRVAASRGYEVSGVGAVVPLGQGVIGMVAKRRKLMRMGNIGQQVAYAGAIRAKMREAGDAGRPGAAAVMPGLPNVQSQVAIPLLIENGLVGVFAVESAHPNIFDERDEILVTILANQAASAIHNARLYRAEGERRAQLDAANEELRDLNENLEEKVRERTLDLRRAQAKLVQSEKMASLGTLVAGIAHELNTPLGALSSMQDTVSRASERIRTLVLADLPEEAPGRAKLGSLFAMVAESGKVMRQGIERVDGIVRRLRSFARLDEAALKEVDLHEGLDDTISTLAHELDGVAVQRRYGTLPRITCFSGRLNQVVFNVLLNARQALRGDPGKSPTAEPGEIVVETEAAADRIILRIRDNGVGIPPEVLPRVFDPGFTTKGVGVGAGLGLAIAYQIVQEHRGEIRIESEPGRGTTVHIELPVRHLPNG